jgi:L-threonylcarbamoyladenylate synthase
LELLRSLPFPLAAPSANLYGTISPTSAAHVYNQLNGRIPIILDGGPCEKGIESTIIGLENNRVHVYRLGGISMEELSLHLEELPLINNKATDHGITSGMVKHHYAPKTPLFFYKEGQRDLSEQSGYIFYKNNPLSDRFKHAIVLSESGDLSEAARKLYSVLHLFDEKGLDKISIERFPNEGLGMTLNDRLNRATAKFTP